MDANPPPQVRHDESARRFVSGEAGSIARLEYDRDGDTLVCHHTEVPPALEGRGIAGALVRAMLEFAEARGLKVYPACSYVRSYMFRRPETHRLLADGVVPPR
jgi:uncharacterized protein